MLKLISNSVLASEIAEALGQQLVGDDVVIYGPANKDTVTNNSLLYFEDIAELEKVDMKNYDEVLVLSNRPPEHRGNISFIRSEQPVIDFIKIVESFFTITVEHKIHDRVIIEQGAKLGKNLYIAPGCYIGSDVTIGDNSILWENVVVKGRTTIGENCVVKPNAIIGSDIFNFVLSNDRWAQLPQIGQIVIENDVWIGANSTIEKGTIGNTYVKSGVRIDDLVQIGSNCVIGEKTMIAAGSIVSRDAKIGAYCWIAPNVTVRDRITIADRVTVGIGAVVVKDIEANVTVVGNPAKKIENR